MESTVPASNRWCDSVFATSGGATTSRRRDGQGPTSTEGPVRGDARETDSDNSGVVEFVDVTLAE